MHFFRINGGLVTGGSLALSFRAEREIFVIRGEGLTLFPHVPRCSAFRICLSCRLCPIREAATTISHFSFKRGFHPQ